MTPDPASGRWLRSLAIAAVLALGVATCARHEAPPATTGHRIVSIGGPVTEIVYALGAGDHVVATDTSSVYPDRATKLPQLGYQRSIAAEAVLAQRPDLVLASADAGPPAAIAQLRAAGVALAIIPTAQTPDEAAARIRAVGAALHLDAQAGAMADAMLVDTRAATVAGGARPRAVLIYARGAGTLMVAGAGTTGGAMLALAGAVNAASGFHGYKTLSPEVLVDAAPDVIVVPSRGLETLGGEAALLALPGVADTPAGRARRFVAIDDLLLLGFGPRLPAAIRALASQMAAKSANQGS